MSFADLVERDDPHLFATTMFAEKRVRDRLLVLYAFDCELSRAVRSSKESLIPRMRLQWWRDVIVAAAKGEPPKAHEVAGPLAQLIQSDQALISDIHEMDGADVLTRMVDGYELELERPFDAETFDKWAAWRFGARLGLAGSISPLGPEYGHDADDSSASKAMAFAVACRTAVRLATASGSTLLYGLDRKDHAELAEGKLSAEAAVILREQISAVLADLKKLRASRNLKGEALVAHLPLRRDTRILRAVARRPKLLVERDLSEDPAFAGIRLAWGAWRRNW